MAVITYSRFFPTYHPRKGEPTFFVEKIWKGLYDLPGMSWNVGKYQQKYDSLLGNDQIVNVHQFEPKWR